MKYGRQRWKLKGKIEVNGKQSWDGEETIFLPLIVGLISIKVPWHRCLLLFFLMIPGSSHTQASVCAKPLRLERLSKTGDKVSVTK